MKSYQASAQVTCPIFAVYDLQSVSTLTIFYYLGSLLVHSHMFVVCPPKEIIFLKFNFLFYDV